MKPFQFYKVGHFPKMKLGDVVTTHFQATFDGVGEDVATSIALLKPDYEGPLDLLRVKSEIKHHNFGFIKTVVNHQRQRQSFSEWLEPVDFNAYYSHKKKLAIFQAPKKVCRGVLANLPGQSHHLPLTSHELWLGGLVWTSGQIKNGVDSSGFHGGDCHAILAKPPSYPARVLR